VTPVGFYAVKAAATRARSVAWLARTGGRLDGHGLRILFYHRVADDRDELAVAPRSFAQQMDYLASQLYEVVDVVTATELLDRDELPARTIGLSFDDGFLDVAEHAMPVLARHGFSATVFVPPSVIDGTAWFEGYRRQPDLLDWEVIGELDREGTLRFEAHSLTHPNLLGLDEHVARHEIEGSKAALEARLERPVEAFAYPSGLFGPRERRLVAEAGFRIAVSCEPGVNRSETDRLSLRRRQIDARDSLLDFRAKLGGGHDTPLPLRAGYRRRAFGAGAKQGSNEPDDRSRDGRRPRVLLLITLAEVGGAQAYVASLLPALAGRFDVVVAAHGRGPLRVAADNADVRFVELEHVRRPINPWRDVAGFVELVRLLRRERPDVLHASSSKAGVLGRLAAWVAGVPIRIFTVHGWAFGAYSGLASRLYRWADRLVRRVTTVTICVSENEREAGIRAGTCDAERTVVIRNAVALDGRPRAGHEQPRPRLVAVGRLKAPKDFSTLVRALALLPADSFDALIVGDGPDRPTLEGELRQLGLESRVRLAGERHDVPDLLAAADVFVLSSVSEGLPVSVLEAMAAELPVVASRVGGLPELVRDGETGLLVEPRNPEQLAAALGRLVADRDLCRRLGAAGRAVVESHFDPEAFARAHVDLYAAELARRSLPGPRAAERLPATLALER
jgi:glycosyltransferase involved in cell wall biosynthesis/peptidoglycan/xylan/chitin deacetylase (PgdA/CDA1 family)